MSVRISNGNGGGFLLEDFVGDGKFSLQLDPARASGLFATSHAHSDHLPRAVAPAAGCIASEETIAFARERGGLHLRAAASPRVTLLNAGHMVGSSMVSVETSAGKLLYTGDFSTRDRLFLKGAEPEKTDILILDGTFAEPEFIFPDLREIISQTRDFLEESDGRAILYGYSYGKAQILTRLANDLGYPVLAQAEVFRANSLARQFGHAVGDCALFGSEAGNRLMHDKSAPGVIIAPQTAAQTLFGARLARAGFSSAFFTGWAVEGWTGGADRAIPLSDHADFRELLSFVKACEPREVIVAHSKRDSALPAALAAIGFPARAASRGFSAEFRK